MTIRFPALGLVAFLFVSLLAGCFSTATPSTPTNVEIINDSSARIGTICIQTNRQSNYAQNADNTFLSRGQSMDFLVDEENTITVELYHGTGRSLGSAFFSQDISWDFRQGKLILRVVDYGDSVAIVNISP